MSRVDERIKSWRKQIGIALVGLNSHAKKRLVATTTAWLRARLEHAATLAEQMRAEREANERLQRVMTRVLERSRSSSTDSR